MRKLVMILSLLFAANAMANERLVPFPGLEIKGGTACAHEVLINDLIQVVNQRDIFRAYFMGYDLSGYCRQGNFNMRLVSKLGGEAISFDGYLMETWVVYIQIPAEHNQKHGWVSGYAMIPSILSEKLVPGHKI